MDATCRPKVLFCDDDRLCHQTITLLLGKSFDVVCCTSIAELMAKMSEVRPDLVLLDIGLENDENGFTAIPHLLRRWPAVPIIIHSAAPEGDAVLRAWRLGASDYIPKSAPPAEIKNQISVELRSRTTAEVDEKAVGESPPFQYLQNRLAQICRGTGNVIITGERGVGKELAARALRKRKGTPAAEPFEALDSATIHGGTAESVLFGHERGAFTGATNAREGLFERANGGIVYFDEIGNMTMDIQAKLLRVIQEQEVVRIGASSPRKLSFRVVCATNKDLKEECRRGEFRRDLLDRLDVFAVRVPPLRESRSDIPLLVEYFLRRHASPGRRYAVTDAVWELLTQYDWPGNIRELSNVVENAVTTCDSDELRPEHILDKLHVALAGTASSPKERGAFSERTRRALSGGNMVAAVDATPPGGGSLRESMKKYECTLLEHAYHEAEGNITKMARSLKIHRTHVYNKLREHGIVSSGRR